VSLVEFSIIIPTFNPDFKIFESINSVHKSILKFKNKIKYEIIIINDGGKKIDKKINDINKYIKIINLKKNKGVGFARNHGAKISKFNKIFYIDSDIVIEPNTLQILFEEFEKLKNAGSLGAWQSYKNLNNEYSSKFVCAKSCYGFEDKPNLFEFSAIHSECCIVSKLFLKKIGGWNYFSKSGGEEFELGHRIIENKKKNYITKKTRYSTWYENISQRMYKLIYRTSNYLPIILRRRKFESSGAFATKEQFFSTLVTSILIAYLFLLNKKINFYVLISIIIVNILIEFNFLKFVKKLYSLKDTLFSILCIFLINFSIIIGCLYGVINLIIKRLNKT
jgi:glycosyltransferase involved in cell wall biosynthesis